jgi:hypothetical protein
VQHLNDLNTTIGTHRGSQRFALKGRRLLLSIGYDEWFRIRIIFKDGVIAGRYPGGILHCSPQLKTNALTALPAKGKTGAFQQGGFVHQAMRRVRNSINSTFRDQISRLVFLSHSSAP